MSFLKNLFGGEPTNQERADAIAREEAARRAAGDRTNPEDQFASPFDEVSEPISELGKENAEPSETVVGWPGLAGVGGIGGFFNALKSGELFYGQLDRMAANLSPEQRSTAIATGLGKLEPQVLADLAARLGVAPDATSTANAMSAYLGQPGGIEALGRQVAPQAVGTDDEFNYFTAVKDPVVQQAFSALFPAIAEAGNSAN